MAKIKINLLHNLKNNIESTQVGAGTKAINVKVLAVLQVAFPELNL